LQTAAATTISNSAFNLNKTSVPATNATPMPIRKVEPSFAWNDANTVADLLANQIENEQDTIPYDVVNAPYSEASAAASVDSLNTEISSASPVLDITQEETQQQAAHSLNDYAPNMSTTQPDIPESAPSVDSLVDAWLAEHAAVPEATDFSHEQELSAVETLTETAPIQQQTAISPNDSTDDI
ncbi:hypothetical protein MT378_23065, partial [Psychrobacter sp. 16-Bac2893]